MNINGKQIELGKVYTAKDLGPTFKVDANMIKDTNKIISENFTITDKPTEGVVIVTLLNEDKLPIGAIALPRKRSSLSEIKKLVHSRLKESNNLMEAGGQAAGKLEIVKTSLDKAVDYVRDSNEYVPGKFEKNYLAAQSKAKLGKTQRKDMPVITDDDVAMLQRRLEGGYIDIYSPKARSTDKTRPFPEGLTGKRAEQWLKAGLSVYDGHKTDDKINVTQGMAKVKDLKPIQKQIYFDKSWNDIDKFGSESSKSFIFGKSSFIVSSDLFILDGHHRFLAGMLLDPTGNVKVLKIDMPINKLLPLLLAYGDAIGNKRNK